jgi:hypothetical protein
MKSRKSITQKHFPRKGTADFVQEPLFALTKSEDVGEQEFSGKGTRSHKRRATDFIRILPRLL